MRTEAAAFTYAQTQTAWEKSRKAESSFESQLAGVAQTHRSETERTAGSVVPGAADKAAPLVDDTAWSLSRTQMALQASMQQSDEMEKALSWLDGYVSGAHGTTETEDVSAPDKQAILDHLATTPYADVLEQIKAGEDVSLEDWQSLLNEMKNINAIGQEEYDVARGDVMLISIGYKDQNGDVVLYEGVGEATGMFDRLREMSLPKDEWVLMDLGEWSNDPLEYLDLWIERFTKWSDDLETKKNDDGTPKYENLDPINRRAEALSNVADLISDLISE